MPIAGSVLCSWVLASLSTLKDPVQYISVIYTRRGARQYCICWFQKEQSWRLGTLHIFLGIKTFLFVKIESCDFQHLFDLEFREKYTKVKANQTTFTEKNFLLGIKVIWMSWNFERFHEIKIEKKKYGPHPAKKDLHMIEIFLRSLIMSGYWRFPGKYGC